MDAESELLKGSGGKGKATLSNEGKRHGMISSLFKIVGLAFVLTALLSIDYLNLTVSQTALQGPLQLVLIAFVDTAVLGYFVKASRWTGWREWSAVFLAFYGVNYLLTAMESVYLGNLLPPKVVLSLLVNGAVVSAIFSAVIVRALCEKGTVTLFKPRLTMRTREWVWKLICAGAVYLLLFVLFGLVVYSPIARILDPAGFIQEQSSFGQAAAMWILPLEALRGIIWALMGVPAILALRFGWRKTALIVSLLFAVPMSANWLLPNALGISPGLLIAHLVEVFSENFVFGTSVVWILNLRSKLSASNI